MHRVTVAALLTNLVNRLRAKGSWCSETHVQKAVYVAQVLAGVPLGFDFILYKHGPFSFDLRDELTSLRADGLLVLEPQAFPYGPKYKATDSAHALQDRFPQTVARYADMLEFIADKLAQRPVAELERLATAFFAKDKLPEANEHERAKWMNRRKPHVSTDEALQALEEVDSLEQQLRRDSGGV